MLHALRCTDDGNFNEEERIESTESDGPDREAFARRTEGKCAGDTSGVQGRLGEL